MTPPTQPLDLGVPQTLKPKLVTREKTLCSVTCPDGCSSNFSRAAPGPGWLVKHTVCTREPVSLFHAQTTGSISTKFCIDLHTNSGKVLNTSMTPSTQPPDPGVTQNPKPKQITGEKRFALQKIHTL